MKFIIMEIVKMLVHKSRYKKSKLKTTLTESQETKKLGDK